jgi:hypothetical protein
LPKYDGNPESSFTNWLQSFNDALALVTTTATTEAQNLARLRFSLTGRARTVYNSFAPEPPNLAEAIRRLRDHFEGPNARTLAKYALSNMRQAPGEKVFAFGERINQGVRKAMVGEPEEAIERRVLDEFCDKLSSKLEFHVKMARPTTFTAAYELAEHYEVLLNQQVQAVVAAAEPAGQRREDESRGRERRSCFYCHKMGHLIRDCRRRMREEGAGGSRSTDGGGRNYTAPNATHTQPRLSSPNRTNTADRSPQRQAPRVRFRDVLAATLPLILLLSIGGVQSQPMVCPGASPSLWRLPQKVECPPADWKANGNVTTLRVQIYRPNTMLYETPVHTCHCRTTNIHRRMTFFGTKVEERTLVEEAVSVESCREMIDKKYSIAGPLKSLGSQTETEGWSTFNSLEVGWKSWPFAMTWTMTPVRNCHLTRSTIYARHGVGSIQTADGDHHMCDYQAKQCRHRKGLSLWLPEPSQSCSYIYLDEQSGEYSSRVWINDKMDFALSFLINNVTRFVCDEPLAQRREWPSD